MQAVVDRRHRQAEKDRNVLVRALVDEEQRRRLPQPVGQPGYRRQRHRRLPALLQAAVGRHLLARQILGFRKRHGPQRPLAQHPERLVSDDAAQPARKRRRVGKADHAATKASCTTSSAWWKAFTRASAAPKAICWNCRVRSTKALTSPPLARRTCCS